MPSLDNERVTKIITSYGEFTCAPSVADKIAAVPMRKNGRPDRRAKAGKALLRYERFIEGVMRGRYLVDG